MEDKVISAKIEHNVFLESRRKLVLSGVNEVDSFEEDNVLLKTTKGNLTIRGNGMKMESYNNEVGDLVLNGNIYALVYTNDKDNSGGGFFGRIFK